MTFEGAFPADPAACSPAFTSTSMPLIAGKLHAPVQASGYLPRPRLDPLLARTLDDAVRLTLLSAGAGYGKSVAVAGWLAAGGVPYAWLSLDGADNDPVRFLRYLVGALEPVRPAVAALPGEGLEKLPAVEQAALLIDALAASDDPFVLVLDDYHVITAAPIHALLRVLIEQGPPFAHLVVVTREDPPFPLPRLRAHGRLVEIRARELRYTEDEAVDYLGSASGVQLDEGQVGQLVGRTEGWIAGLQLAAISLRDRPATPMIASFTGSQRHVLDYLGSEVVDGLDPDMRMMLVSASVADRFTANLCDRLVDRSDSARLLDAAERMNLFLIPLDDTCCWYRFHHLFGAYLRTLLEPAEEHTLRDRAADFLEGEGLYDEAIPQAIEAGSIERAVRLLEAHGRATYESGELSTLLRWLDALPDGATESSAELCALRAWSAFNVGRVGDAMRVCEAAEAAHAGERPTASILAVRATVAAFTNRPGAIELAQAALADTEADPFYLMLARYALAVGQLSAGRLEAAMASAREVLPQAWGPGRSTLVVPAVTTIASSLLYLGRRDEAEALCRETLEAHRAEARSLAGGTPYAMHWLGMTLYEAGEVEAALVEMERGWAAMGTFGFGRAVLTFAAAWLALARLAAGSLPGALEVVRTMRRDAASAGLTGVDEAFAEMEARVQALSGEVAAAARWADALEAGRPRAGAVSAPGPAPEPVTEPGDRWSELAPSITLARVRLAQGRCQEAAEHLRRARAIAESIGHVADLVSIGVLEAAVALRGGDRAMAQSRLEHAVQNAAPARYIQRFVDDGALVAPLLAGVRSTAPAFVDEVTRAMAVRSGAEVRVPVERGARTPSTGHEPLLVEPLTDRELEVLGLIARGLSDAAIADELVVSLATAKWHAAHIRGKLGVTTRTQAVLRAQELALV